MQNEHKELDYNYDGYNISLMEHFTFHLKPSKISLSVSFVLLMN